MIKPHLFLVVKVPAEQQAAANAVAADFDYDVGGNRTFDGPGYNHSGLSADPPEFYIVEVAVRPDTAAAVAEADLPEGVEIYTDAPWSEVLGDLKLRGSEDE